MRRTYPSGRLLGNCLAVFCLLALAGAPAAAQPIFADGFESGNTFAWQSIGELPPLVAADSYRTNELLLRDPHVFVDLPVFGCFDFTDTNLPLGLGPSFNAQLATSMTSDADFDGYLDLSLMFLGRPFSPSASNVRLDTAAGWCAVPAPPTSCGRNLERLPQTHYYSAQAAGICLDVLPGTTSGYSPPVTVPAASCFITVARNLSFEAAGLTLPLIAVQAAATFLGNPATALSPGLLRGFLTEADADTILLPPEVPIVGGQPLSILLPGGTNNCAGHDARDTFEMQSGWWFYFNSTAVPMPWTGP